MDIRINKRLRDSYKHKGARERLVREIADKGISDERVLEAMRRVPRHLFIESAFEAQAYEDKPLPIGFGQTISQPFTVAFQSQMLQLKPRMKVLEIGTGSGYQAAVLCEMGMRVFSVEYDRNLHRRAKEVLEELGYKARLECRDGSRGWPTYQPYERILVTAASPSLPEPLKAQLEIGGHMVIPQGDLDTQTMVEVIRISGQEYELRRHQNFRFVPLRGKFGFGEEE